MQEHETRWSRASLLAAAVLFLTALAAFVQSYQRWLDPIIDTGRDLYIATALGHGARLYRDIRYQYPPLAPYLLAAITRILGSSLRAFVMVGVLQSAAIVAALFALLRRSAGTAAAFAASLLFLALCFCGASTWGCNFIFPYSYAATLGLALLLGYAALLHRHLFESHTGATFYGAAVLGIMAAWCKLEYALVFAVTFVVMAALHRVGWKKVAIVAAGAVVSFVAAWSLFHSTLTGYDWLRDNVFAASLISGKSATEFFAEVAGTGSPARSLERAFAGCVFLGMMTIALTLIDRIIARRPDSRVSVMLVAGAGFAAIGWMLPPNWLLFRAWTLLLPVGVVWALLKDRRGPSLFFLLLAMTAVARIPLNITPDWYGFALIVPLLAAMSWILFGELPKRAIYSRSTAMLWLPLFIVISGKAMWDQHLRYEMKRFPIHTSQGTFYDFNEARAKAINGLLPVLKTSKAKSLVVMPEGLTLNYLSGIPTPLSFHTFTPPETASEDMERQVMNEMHARRPDMVLLVTRDVSEYRSGGFGFDYDQRLMTLLRTDYQVRQVWPEPRFQAVLLSRRSDADR